MSALKKLSKDGGVVDQDAKELSANVNALIDTNSLLTAEVRELKQAYQELSQEHIDKLEEAREEVETHKRSVIISQLEADALRGGLQRVADALGARYTSGDLTFFPSDKSGLESLNFEGLLRLLLRNASELRGSDEDVRQAYLMHLGNAGQVRTALLQVRVEQLERTNNAMLMQLLGTMETTATSDAVITEQEAKIAELEAKNTALKAKVNTLTQLCTTTLDDLISGLQKRLKEEMAGTFDKSLRLENVEAYTSRLARPESKIRADISNERLSTSMCITRDKIRSLDQLRTDIKAMVDAPDAGADLMTRLQTALSAAADADPVRRTSSAFLNIFRKRSVTSKSLKVLSDRCKTPTD